jgi:hypothetical protein
MALPVLSNNLTAVTFQQRDDVRRNQGPHANPGHWMAGLSALALLLVRPENISYEAGSYLALLQH